MAHLGTKTMKPFERTFTILASASTALRSGTLQLVSVRMTLLRFETTTA
jgi:hypothetical protein